MEDAYNPQGMWRGGGAISRVFIIKEYANASEKNSKLDKTFYKYVFYLARINRI